MLKNLVPQTYTRNSVTGTLNNATD